MADSSTPSPTSTGPQPYAAIAAHAASYNHNDNNSNNSNSFPPQQQQQQQPFRRSSSGGTDSNHSGSNSNYYVGIPQQQQQNFNSSYQRSNSGGPTSTSTSTSYGPPAYGNTSYGHNCSAVNTTDPEQVDSALLAALREPRERTALLQLEAVLVHFLQQDSAGWLEVAGPYNGVIFSPTTQTQPPSHMMTTDKRQTSFQRCVLHRLADRFGIVREPGALLGPGSLRLIKLPHSQLPTLLIADMAERISVPPVMAPTPDSNTTNNNGNATNEENATATNNNNNSKTPIRKVKLMKRSTNAANGANGSAHNGTGSNPAGLRKKTLASGEDKERAYAEARARIFQEEQQETTVVTDNNATNNNNSSTTTTNPLSCSMTQLSESTASLSLFPSSSSDHPQPVLTAKAVYRNRAQEEADPDFKRQPGAAPMLFYPHVPLQAAAPVWTPRHSGNDIYNNNDMAPPPTGTTTTTTTVVTSTDDARSAPPQHQHQQS